MRYSVYVVQPNQPDAFLMSSDRLEVVKKDHQSLRRWRFEMNVDIVDMESTKYVISDCGVPAFERPCLGPKSRSWVKLAPQNP